MQDRMKAALWAWCEAFQKAANEQPHIMEFMKDYFLAVYQRTVNGQFFYTPDLEQPQQKTTDGRTLGEACGTELPIVEVNTTECSNAVSCPKCTNWQIWSGEFNCRCQKERLVKYHLAAFQGTSKGTIATLIDTMVFDIFGNSRGEQKGTLRANEGRTKGERGATNEKGKKVKEGKELREEAATPPPRNRFQKPTPQQVTEYGAQIEFTVNGQAFVDYYEARGWKHKGGTAMRDWQAAVRTWKKCGSYFRAVKKPDLVVKDLSAGQKCATCRFFAPAHERKGTSFTLMLQIPDRCRKTHIHERTTPDDWCGEWEGKESESVTHEHIPVGAMDSRVCKVCYGIIGYVKPGMRACSCVSRVWQNESATLNKKEV